MSRRAGLAGAALALLALVLVRGNGGGPPLYDGICTPVHYLTLGASPGPKSVSQTFTAAELAQTFELADDPNTPQAQLIVTAAALAPAPGSQTVTVSINPVKPPATQPSDGTIDGNVYDFEARSGGQRRAAGAQQARRHRAGSDRHGRPADRHRALRRHPLDAGGEDGAERLWHHVPGEHADARALCAGGPGADARAGGSAPPSGGSPAILVIVLVLAVIAVLVFAILIAVRTSRKRARKGRRRR